MYSPQKFSNNKRKQNFKKSSFSDNNDKKLDTLHKNLANEWQLQGPDTRRILLDLDKSQLTKKKDVFISADPFADEGKAIELRKGANMMRKMTHPEQMHKLQSALQDRIMVHKFNDNISVVYKSQIKSIRQLMEYLNRQIESLGKVVSLKKPKTFPEISFDSFVELKPAVLVRLSDSFYKDKLSSRTVDDKVFPNQPGGQLVPSTALRLLRKDRRDILVDKIFEDGTDTITQDFPNFLQENETDFYFLLGFSSRPSIKQLLSTFRDVHQLSLKYEQQMYHLFRLSILSNILITRAYSAKCLL